MPAGVAWGTYLKFTVCAFLSMFAGSQMVHLCYRPLDDIEKYVDKAKKEYKSV